MLEPLCIIDVPLDVAGLPRLLVVELDPVADRRDFWGYSLQQTERFLIPIAAKGQTTAPCTYRGLATVRDAWNDKEPATGQKEDVQVMGWVVRSVGVVHC